MLGLPLVSERGSSANRSFFWFALVGVLALVPLDIFFQQFSRGLRERTLTSPHPEFASSEVIDPPGIGAICLESKYHVRVREFVVTEGWRFEEPPDWLTVVEELASLAQTRTEKVRVAIVAGELLGREVGIERLGAIEREVEPGGALAGDIYWFKRALTEGAEAISAEADRSLRERHGWFGELALARGNSDEIALRAPPTRGGDAIFGAVRAMGLLNLVVGALGILAVIALAALWKQGYFESAAFEPTEHAPVYLEAFCIFLLSFIVLLGVQVMSLWTTGTASIAMFVVCETLLWAGVIGMAWPILRGVPLDTMRLDLGLTTGERVPAEILCGVLVFLAILPVYAILDKVVTLIFEVAAQTDPASESEAVGEIGFPSYRRPLGHSWVLVWVSVVSAVVWAPIFEEFFFRGALFRALRQWGGPWLAVPVSAVVFGFGHPYDLHGLIMVSLAGVAFGLVREWRSSLIAPITMHVLYNGFINLQEVWFLAAVD